MTTTQKPLPADTWENLYCPPAGYVYFENCGQYDFEPPANKFSWRNAWWLADAAVLAYVHDWSCVDAVLATASFDERRAIGDDPALSTKGFFAARTGAQPFAVVAYRGTDKDDPRDLRTDLNTIPVPRDGYLVHEGFADALDQVWQAVAGMLGDFAGRFPGAPVYFTGHSLGAALATISVTRYAGGPSALYTIGSPRVGDSDLVAALSRRTTQAYRFVNSQDIVTQVPPPVLFTHAGVEKYIDRAGIITDNPSDAFKAQDLALGSAAHARPLFAGAFHGLGQFVAGHAGQGPTDPPPYALGNHSPGRYPVRIWNYYSARGI